MRPDDHTVPIGSWHPPGMDATPQEPNPFADFPVRDQVPTWPGVAARGPSEHMQRQASGGGVSAAAFGISLGANIVLGLALIAVLALMFSHADTFLPSSGSGPSASGLPQSTPTATATPASSPTASAGRLQLTPSSVQLGCEQGQRTQFVILRNTGTETVRWQATFSPSGEQAGVTVYPQRGTLAAGASVPVQIQNTTKATDEQGLAGQQGSVMFEPRSSDDGPSTSLTYTTVGCQ